MQHSRASYLLFLYAMQSPSLVLSNMPRSNPTNQGTPQTPQPANLIQPQNQTASRVRGTDHDIGSNLAIYIILGDPAPAQTLYQLLLLAKDQVQDRAALFGPTTLVPHRKANPELTQTIYAELEYFIEPARVLNPRRPGLEWGEFEVLTFWLYEYLWILLNHQECTFLLFRRNVTTGQELNLAFGGIKPVKLTAAVDATSSVTARLLPAESFSQSK